MKWLLLVLALASGCLDQVIPPASFDGSIEDPATGGAGAADLGTRGQPAPLDDGGQPIGFRDIQTTLDSLGCATASCHGGSQTPVLALGPTTEGALRSSFDDFTVGCSEGAPNPGNCIDLANPSASLELTKPLAGSGVDHMGGKAFASTSDPVYQLWLAWISAGAPY